MDGKTPETWNEFTALCEQIQSEGVQPLYLDLKTHGPVLHRGMLWLLVWRTRSFAVR